MLQMILTQLPRKIWTASKERGNHPRFHAIQPLHTNTGERMGERYHEAIPTTMPIITPPTMSCQRCLLCKTLDKDIMMNSSTADIWSVNEEKKNVMVARPAVLTACALGKLPRSMCFQ